METIIEKLRRYTEMNPGAAILFDDAHSKGITYAQLDDMSARVCGWLKAIAGSLSNVGVKNK